MRASRCWAAGCRGAGPSEVPMKNAWWPVVLVLGLSAFSMQAAERAVVTIHLAGDSTMAGKLPQKRPETGWGELLAAQFQPGTVRVDNHAKNGRSTRTFIEEGRWQAWLDATQPGDVVL